MIKNKALAISALFSLSGCLEMSMSPVVSGYNGDSVNIQEPGLQSSSPPSQEAIAKAQETCSASGKEQRFASGRMVADATVEYLFLCV